MLIFLIQITKIHISLVETLKKKLFKSLFISGVGYCIGTLRKQCINSKIMGICLFRTIPNLPISEYPFNSSYFDYQIISQFWCNSSICFGDINTLEPFSLFINFRKTRVVQCMDKITLPAKFHSNQIDLYLSYSNSYFH